MYAIGNDELEEKEKAGKTALCPKCKKRHKIRHGTDTKTGKTSNLLGFVNCGKESYLVAVAGKLI
jgi:ssDNA-binding Zn-finger/Zn-ribbon topoisomerase 1